MPALLIEVLGHRNLIKGRHLRIRRASRNGDRERATALRVAPRDPAGDLTIESFELSQIVIARPGPEIEPFMPAASVKDSLFGIAAEVLLGYDGLAVGIAAFQYAHLVKQRDEIAVLFHRGWKVMRAPGVSYYPRVAAARGPSRLALELKEDEIIKACFQ
jgi:hypothetical protein